MDVFYRDYLAQREHPVDDEVLSQALKALEGAALKFSAEVISDSKKRDKYNYNVGRVKAEVLAQVKAGSVSMKEAAEFCYEARNKIMAEVRTKTSAHGLAVAQTRKTVPVSLEKLLNEKSMEKMGRRFVDLDALQKKTMFYDIVESFAGTAVKFNTLNKVLKVSGKVLIIVTIAYATYEVARAANKPKESIPQGITVIGGLSGTALAGLAVSTVCGPAAPFCTVGLMLAGGIASGWAASEVADSLDDELQEFIQWNLN